MLILTSFTKVISSEEANFIKSFIAYPKSMNLTVTSALKAIL